MNATTKTSTDVRPVAVSDWVRTDWALGSQDGATHYGMVIGTSPDGSMVKVDWITGGLRRLVRSSTVQRVTDEHVASRIQRRS